MCHISSQTAMSCWTCNLHDIYYFCVSTICFVGIYFQQNCSKLPAHWIRTICWHFTISKKQVIWSYVLWTKRILEWRKKSVGKYLCLYFTLHHHLLWVLSLCLEFLFHLKVVSHSFSTRHSIERRRSRCNLILLFEWFSFIGHFHLNFSSVYMRSAITSVDKFLFSSGLFDCITIQKKIQRLNVRILWPFSFRPHRNFYLLLKRCLTKIKVIGKKGHTTIL